MDLMASLRFILIYLFFSECVCVRGVIWEAKGGINVSANDVYEVRRRQDHCLCPRTRWWRHAPLDSLLHRLSMSIYAYVYLCLLRICLNLCLSMSAFMSADVYVCLCMCIFIYVNMSICVCLFMSLSMSVYV